MEKITVQTLTNGYELNIGEKSYMYFSLPKLILGIAYHCNEATTKDAELFVESLYQKKRPLEFFSDKIKEANNQTDHMRKQRDEMNERNRELREEIASEKIKAHHAEQKAERLQKKLDILSGKAETKKRTRTKE